MVFCRYLISLLLCIAAPAISKAQTVVKPHQPTVADYDRLISYYRYFKPDSAIYYSQKAITLARLKNDYNGLAVILNQQGMIKDNLGQFGDSRQDYLTALELYKRTGKKQGIATENVRLGVVEMRKGNYDRAVGYFLESLRVAEQSNNAFGRMEALVTLSEAYSGQRKFDIALKYLNQADQINHTLPFSNLSLNILNDYGTVYRETGQYEKAKTFFNKGIVQSNVPQYQGLNITLTNNLASVYSKQGFRNKSIELQKLSLTKARTIKNYLRELLTLTSLAETYGTDNAEQALFYFKQALKLVKERGAQKQALEILDHIADLYHHQHNDTQAYLTKQEEYAIADKYFYQGMAKQIVSLQSDYELNKSKARVQELNYLNAKQDWERKVMLLITGAVLLLLLVLALYFNRIRRYNGLLNKANAELQESNTVKDKLFSVLAHDLRSPFATIINLLQVINDDDLPANERKELIEIVSLTSSASLDILNNLLKWGEMQIKGIRLNPINLNPRDIIRRNISMLAGAAEMKRIHIHNQVNESLIVITDADHFEFILRNLLSNAIKFTSEGGDVTINALADKAHHEVQFTVTDNGIGIMPEKLKQIFDISNVSTQGTNAEKGTSLGLLLCKEFIEANNGRIWVESQVGKGSRFIFTLKCSKVKPVKNTKAELIAF